MKKKIIMVLILIVCAAAAAGLVILFLKMGEQDAAETAAAAETAKEENQSQAVYNTITYNGEEYELNKNIKNYLFMGVDEREDDFTDEDIAPGDAGQADCLILLSLDEENKEARILQINRNAMTELDIYLKTGQVQRQITGQVCLQYAYCIGGKSSCLAQKKTVSELLFGVDIDGYLCMQLAGIGEVNDALGGVDVTMDQDYTEIDPDFKEGATVHLMGEQATEFVHYRNVDEFNSVQGRMERQTTYITAMINSLKSKGTGSLYNILEPYFDDVILTDLTAEEMDDLKNYEYDTDEVLYLPGEMVMGEQFEEFNVDNSQLQDMFIQLFYKRVKS